VIEVFVKNIISDLLDSKWICKNSSAQTDSAIKPKKIMKLQWEKLLSVGKELLKEVGAAREMYDD